jgi:transmembrane sensor
MEQMLAEADAARRAGRLEDASRALRAAIAAHAEDPRAATALFLLGRVERTRGRDAAAAEAFEAGYARDPDAVLAEDALAEAAVSWSAASRSERAREAARRYLARYPAGEYADRVRHLAE